MCWQHICIHCYTHKGMLLNENVCFLETAAFRDKASPGKDAAPHAKVQEGCADTRDLHFVLIERPAEHAVQAPQIPPLHSAQSQHEDEVAPLPRSPEKGPS